MIRNIIFYLTFLFFVGDRKNFHPKVYRNLEVMADLPWMCDFGLSMANIDMCGFHQDTRDDANWTPNVGHTPTNFTGPPPSTFEEHGA